MGKSPKNINTVPIPKLDWSDEHREESIQAMYAFAEKNAQSATSWYWNKAGQVGWKGRSFRLAAILLTTLGGLIPLLLAADVDLSWMGTFSQDGSGPQYSQWGYVFLALAGACLALDKFFGFSSSWIRYVTTATELQTGLTQFYIDWAELNAKLGGKPIGIADAEQLLARLRQLVSFAREKTETETQAWAAEYQNNLRELETRIKADMEKQKPGSITVNVPNASEAADDVVVSIDGVLVRRITAGVTATFQPVFPGQHEVDVAGTINGRKAAAAAVVSVAPGEVASITLPLKDA